MKFLLIDFFLLALPVACGIGLWASLSFARTVRRQKAPPVPLLEMALFALTMVSVLTLDGPSDRFYGPGWIVVALAPLSAGGILALTTAAAGAIYFLIAFGTDSLAAAAGLALAGLTTWAALSFGFSSWRTDIRRISAAVIGRTAGLPLVLISDLLLSPRRAAGGHRL
mgnify:FL=1